jgi:uncharacterized repeat protein (TIGR03803 family)
MKPNSLSKPETQSSPAKVSLQNASTAGLCGLLLLEVSFNTWADDFTPLEWMTCHYSQAPLVQGTDGSLYGTSRPFYNNVFRFNGGCWVLKEFWSSDTGYVGGPLLLSGNTLYGNLHAGDGGSTGGGILYRINTDGNGYAVLKDFTSAISDGAQPCGGMVLSGDMLYGTAEYGGTYGCGVVFKMSTNGSSYAVLKHFNGTDGSNPEATLLLSDSTLYGTTYGTTNSGGNIFKINTDGSGFQVLKTFDGGTWTGPRAGLALSGTNLYGTTWGGAWTHGCVFRVGTDGSGYTVLKQFTGPDGSMPRGDLLLRDNWLFGTTESDTTYAKGLIFKVNTDGSHFVMLHQFYPTTGYSFGAPRAGLILVGTSLYGTCFVDGCIFRLSAPFPPTILSSPLTQTAETGQEVDFRADAAGSPPFGYQLLFQGSVIAASASPTIQLMNVQTSQAGLYSVIVTNLYDAVTSSPAMLNVIPSVGRRIVPAIKVMGDSGSLLNVDYASTLTPVPDWSALGPVSLTSASQFCFDLTTPLPPQRFYRAWQTGMPAVVPSLSQPCFVPAITLSGNVGDSLHLDYINAIGPTDAWVPLATVTLTNTSQLYFDTSSIGQPRRLWRIVPVP